MNRPLVLALGATTLLVHLVGCASQTVAARNDAERFAYGVGFDLGRSVREGLADDGIEADAALVRRGFEDGLGGRTPALPQHEMDRVLRAVHREMAERQARRLYAEDAEFRALADANAAASEAMVAAFAARPGARRIESGAYAIVEAEGSGRTVGEDAIAIADWRATTADGRAIAGGDGVRLDPRDMLPIPGRTLKAMRVGDRWALAFSAEQVYGLAGDPPAIGPNEAILVEIAVTGLLPKDDA